VPLPPGVTIRDARSDELDAVGALTAEAYEEYMPDESATEERRRSFAEYREDMRDVRARVERGALVIVAEREGPLVGSVTYYAPGVDKSEEGWPPEIAAMRLLGVIPSARGLGIGRALTDETLGRARSASAPAFGLHTTDLMAIARGMYERMGFVRVPENDFWPAPDLLVSAYRLDL
jgi:ribosomal protein S18 acetylase RimI-like enzyme